MENIIIIIIYYAHMYYTRNTLHNNFEVEFSGVLTKDQRTTIY